MEHFIHLIVRTFAMMGGSTDSAPITIEFVAVQTGLLFKADSLLKRGGTVFRQLHGHQAVLCSLVELTCLGPKRQNI